MQDIVEVQSLFDLKKVGIRPDKVISAKKIHEKHGNQLWRIKNPESSFVLKLYFDINQATEIKCYPLLNELQILTLPVHGACDNALLLEDLDCSLIWRLATAGDMYNPETGIAVAQWYLMFHAAVRQYVSPIKKFPQGSIMKFPHPALMKFPHPMAQITNSRSTSHLLLVTWKFGLSRLGSYTVAIGTTKRAVALTHHEDMVGAIDEPVEGPLSKDRVGKQRIPILWSAVGYYHE